jgi:predicted CxxxxCH...CXXCH cytochrome family protein
VNFACTYCHVNPNWTTYSHRDGNIQMRVPLNGQWGTYSRGGSFAQTNITTFGTCNGVYCHSTVQSDGGNLAGVTYASPRWGSAATAPCGSCHLVPPGTGKHAKHVAWASFRGMTTTSSCNTCHAGAGDETVLHARGTINLAINTMYYGITTALYSQGNQAPGSGYGNCQSVYCHGGWSTAGGTAMTPNWTTVGGPVMACGECHAATGTTPPNTGSHYKHAGNWSSAIGMLCSQCHGATAGSSTHADLNVQWSFDQTDARISTIARYKGAAVGSTGAKARVAAYGSCTNVYCHSNVQANGGLAGPTVWATPTWGSAATGACGTCHAMPNTSGAHARHDAVYGTTAAVCQACHNGAGDQTVYHARGTINMRINTTYWNISTALYSQGEHKGAGGAYGTCAATTCHGGPSNNWGSLTSNHQCTKCHGAPWTSAAGWASNIWRAAPGANGTGLDTWNSTGAVAGGVSNAPRVGAHDTHLRGLNTISDPVECNQCHTVPASPTSAGHIDVGTNAELVWGTWANWNTTVPAIAWSTTNRTCTNTYCHGGKMPNGDTSGANRAPAWTTGGYLVGPVHSQASTITGGCGTCHGAPPTAGTSAAMHAGVVFPGDCNGCHPHIAANGSTSTVSLHIDGIVQGGGDCVGCHSATQTISVGPLAGQTRRAVAAEFNNTWSHKRSALGTVKPADCIVCHMEGDKATGGQAAPYHGNGTLELRDPDTGTTIQRVVWVSVGGVAGLGWYTNTGTVQTISRFSRNLASNVLEPEIVAIQNNHCLNCHDANGALSSNAWVSGGSALQPFMTTISGHVAPFSGNGQGNVVDVYSQFWTSNSTYHPVLGRGNNSYIGTGTNVQAPWKMSKTVGTTTQWGHLMSCWDCHAGSGAVNTITQSVTAHGAPATLRGQVFAIGTTTTTNLCVNCHTSSTYIVSGQHATPSAFQGGATNMNGATMMKCAFCHAYTAAQAGTAWVTLTSRPLRADNVHGFNDRDPVTAGQQWWTRAGNHRPYAFIRNTLSFWAPTSVPTGEAVGTARGCTGTAGTCNNNMGATTTYTTGGAY